MRRPAVRQHRRAPDHSELKDQTTMASNDSMAGQPPISTSQTTQNTTNAVCGHAAGELTRGSTGSIQGGLGAVEEIPFGRLGASAVADG